MTYEDEAIENIKKALSGYREFDEAANTPIYRVVDDHLDVDEHNAKAHSIGSDIVSLIDYLLCPLPYMEREVIKCIYCYNPVMPMSAIAKSLEMSRSKLYRIRDTAILRLSRMIPQRWEKRLEVLLND